MGMEDFAVDMAEDPGPIRIYIYGEPGSGKTIFACGAPKPCLIDTENSRRSLLNHPDLLRKLDGKILKGRNYAELEKILFAIVDGDSFFDDVETIIIDTLSELQKRELSALVKEAHKKNSARNPDLPSEFEYNINNQRMRKLLLAFIEQTDKNLVLTGHVKEEKDNGGATSLTRPDQSPGFTSTVLALVDGAFYLSSNTTQAGATKRTLRFLPTASLKAKNRFGPLPLESIDPTFDIILQADRKQRDVARKLQEEKEENNGPSSIDEAAISQQPEPEQQKSVLNI